MLIDFGKHKGKNLLDIPNGYLRWMLKTCELSKDLRRGVECALQGREYEPPPLPDVDVVVDEVCRPWEDYGRES